MANCVLRRAVPQPMLAASPAIKGSSAIKGAPVVVRIAPSRDYPSSGSPKSDTPTSPPFPPPSSPPHIPLACASHHFPFTILSFLTSPVPHALIARAAAASQATAGRSRQRDIVRLALPSKGRMAEDTLALLKECELTVRKPNPRQYIAEISEIEGLEVWFQRASDCVRKLLSGDVDMTIVGYDMVKEYGKDDPNLVIVHDSLGFGKCHLSIAVPSYGIFERVNSIQDLIAMPQWSAENPLRIVTGYTHLGRRFFDQLGFSHVQLSTADGALEAAPAMGTADAILDLVSTGTTLKENNLKELKGADVLKSQGVFVVSRRALEEREGLLGMTKEMLERIEAHLCARDQYIVTANMRGLSEEDVAHRVLENTSFPGLQGPTISRVYSRGDDSSDGAAGIKVDYFSATVVVPRAQIYKSIRELRKAGGSGVLVTPVTYIFDEEPPRWKKLLSEIGL
ncbi:unnamed protein product [Closterium sp. NIES-64]|nr:unnamed protein product [Closterium sp. NIES-64]